MTNTRYLSPSTYCKLSKDTRYVENKCKPSKDQCKVFEGRQWSFWEQSELIVLPIDLKCKPCLQKFPQNLDNLEHAFHNI